MPPETVGSAGQDRITDSAAKRRWSDGPWLPIVAVLIWCVLFVGAVLIFGWDS